MAVIFCFSSTGNSLYTARKIAEYIGAETLPITYESVKTVENYVPLYKVNNTNEIHAAAEQGIQSIAVARKDGWP